MEENQKSTFSVSLMPGIVLGFALIVFSIILYLMELPYDSNVRYLSLVIMALGIWWAQTTSRDKTFGGNVSFGKAFLVGFWVTVISTIIASVYTYLYFSAINPGIVDEILLNTEEEMLNANPDMTDAQIEQALSMTEIFVSPVVMTIFGLIFSIAAGAVLSLLIAIFVKRENETLA